MLRFFNWHERLLIWMWLLAAPVGVVAAVVMRLISELPPNGTIGWVVAVVAIVTWKIDREVDRRNHAHECMMSWSRRISDEGPTCSPLR